MKYDLDCILTQIKGADVRRSVRRTRRRSHRQAIHSLDSIVELLQKYNARLIARVWIKKAHTPIDGRAIYTSSLQALYTHVQRWMQTKRDEAIILVDSRMKHQNVYVSHSIFTGKYRRRGDRWPRVLECPAFGHSDNHGGLQLVDYICSALLYPIASYVYCTGYVQNDAHVSPNYRILWERYRQPLNDMQFRYAGPDGKFHGGVVISDQIEGRSGALMFPVEKRLSSSPATNRTSPSDAPSFGGLV